MPDDHIDEDLEVWDQFVAAIRHLARTSRPGLTMAEATQEALLGWVAEQSTTANRGRPFAS